MNRHYFWAVLAVAVAGGCKKQPAETASSAETTKSTDKTGTAIGAEQVGTFTCKDVKDDACIDPTDRFEATAPVVHMTYKTKDLPKNGDVYQMQWIAEDVGDAAPANTVIATVEEEVKDAVDGMQNYVVNSRLSKPNNGWPVGKYRVEVKRGGNLETTARFSIE